jgi:hypothetical protein
MLQQKITYYILLPVVACYASRSRNADLLELRQSEVRRIVLPRTPVNKG